MLWFKKNKKEPPKQEKKLSREELIAKAQATAREARAQIGEDTLARIALAMEAKQKSAIEKAKRQIKEADQDKVIDHLKMMIEEDKKN